MTNLGTDNWFSTDTSCWYASTLWAAAEGLPVEEVEIETLPEYAQFKEWIENYKRILAADTSYPIILTPEGHVADGYHRCSQLLLNGSTKVKVVRLAKMPEPDKYLPQSSPLEICGEAILGLMQYKELSSYQLALEQGLISDIEYRKAYIEHFAQSFPWRHEELVERAKVLIKLIGDALDCTVFSTMFKCTTREASAALQEAKAAQK